jgi:phage/plasmid primase-like uncharacterized protein
MADTVSDLARRLAENAEAVCRYYLSNGRRQGGYWIVGDVHNAPGRSLYVRLRGPSAGKGAAGKWTDAADGGHGDLLDLIGAVQGLHGGDLLDEARRFLGMVRAQRGPPSPTTAGSPEAARRLFAMARPIGGTLAEAYLRERGITVVGEASALRFHQRCWYRPDAGTPDGARNAWPALLGAVTDGDGEITGLQRTWLDPSGRTKAPVATPRRAMGHLLGNAVRFGVVRSVMAAGEGIETVLSLPCALPSMPLAAALSAGHLAALLFPSGLRRLYLVRDNDPAGHWAAEQLMARAQAAGIEALVLAPTLGDWNDDRRELGPGVVATALRTQLAPEDVTRFWRAPGRGGRTG